MRMSRVISVSLLLVCALLFVGCSASMSNQDIVKETKFCKDNGLETFITMNVYNEITSIQCYPTAK